MIVVPRQNREASSTGNIVHPVFSIIVPSLYLAVSRPSFPSLRCYSGRQLRPATKPREKFSMSFLGGEGGLPTPPITVEAKGDPPSLRHNNPYITVAFNAWLPDGSRSPPTRPDRSTHLVCRPRRTTQTVGCSTSWRPAFNEEILI